MAQFGNCQSAYDSAVPRRALSGPAKRCFSPVWRLTMDRLPGLSNAGSAPSLRSDRQRAERPCLELPASWSAGNILLLCPNTPPALPAGQISIGLPTHFAGLVRSRCSGLQSGPRGRVLFANRRQSKPLRSLLLMRQCGIRNSGYSALVTGCWAIGPTQRIWPRRLLCVYTGMAWPNSLR